MSMNGNELIPNHLEIKVILPIIWVAISLMQRVFQIFQFTNQKSNIYDYLTDRLFKGISIFMLSIYQKEYLHYFEVLKDYLKSYFVELILKREINLIKHIFYFCYFFFNKYFHELKLSSSVFEFCIIS